MLSAGTGSGHIAMWKFKPALNPAVAAKQEPEDKWLLQPACTIDSCASSLTVSGGLYLLLHLKSHLI